MKMGICCLFLFLLFGCRTYYPEDIKTAYSYDTNEISKNYEILNFDLNSKGVKTKLSKNSKKYQVILDSKCEYKSKYQLYSDFMAILNLATLGTISLTGLPIGSLQTTCNVSASIYSKNSNVIKMLSGQGEASEVSAMYYGYTYSDCVRKTQDIAFFTARNNVLDTLKMLPISEIDKLNDKDTKKIKALEDKRRKEQQKIKMEQKKRNEMARVKRKEKLSKKYDSFTVDSIIEGEIFIGMSEDALIESWGHPKRINETVGRWGVHKQYVYWSKYVYVENGKITSWSTNR